MLAEIYSESLEAEGYPVRRFGLGPGDPWHCPRARADRDGPWYVSTRTAFLSMGDLEPSKIVGVTHDQLRSVAEGCRR